MNNHSVPGFREFVSGVLVRTAWRRFNKVGLYVGPSQAGEGTLRTSLSSQPGSLEQPGTECCLISLGHKHHRYHTREPGTRMCNMAAPVLRASGMELSSSHVPSLGRTASFVCNSICVVIWSLLAFKSRVSCCWFSSMQHTRILL